MATSEKVAALFVAAVISLAGVLVAFYQGTPPDWGPTGDLLVELITSGGAAAFAFLLMQRIKAAWPALSSNAQFWIHMALAVVISPVAWWLLILLNLTEFSPRGAVMIAGVTYATGKAIYAQYKEGKKKEAEKRANVRLMEWTGEAPR